jgi:hypothetical protein
MLRCYALAASLILVTLSSGLEGARARARAEDKSDCSLTTTRTACAGQAAESYKKCDGKQSCTKATPADSEQACQAAAVASCSNDRPTITKSKVITATWKGKALKNKAGQADQCADYAKKEAEFNKCEKK